MYSRVLWLHMWECVEVGSRAKRLDRVRAGTDEILIPHTNSQKQDVSHDHEICKLKTFVSLSYTGAR